MPARRKLSRKRLRNIEIAQKFEAIADMLAMQSANPFRIRAYQNAARTLRRHSVEMSDMIAHGEDLSELEGVGEDLATKIRDLAETGTTEMYEELRRQTPDIAFVLIETPGVGPKRAHALIDELGVTSLTQLKRAAREGRVRDVPGFGPKSEAELLKALEQTERPARRAIAEAAVDADALIAHMRAAPGAEEAVVAGSYRRGRESVGDLDLLVAAEKGPPVIEHFKRFPGVADITASGTTRAAIVLRTGLGVDLRVVRPESFGAALLYFTGSKAHVVALRALVRERGMKLNEYGLYRGKRRMRARTEAELYAALGLDFIPPELREARGEIQAARAHALPHLVASSDLKGDLHVRCGREPVAALVAAAKARGLDYVALVSRVEDLGKGGAARRREEIERTRNRASPMRLLHAVEAQIAEDGALEAREDALAGADLVLARAGDTDLPRERQTKRLLAAIADPRVAILSQPTGRVINRREASDADWPRIMHAAADAGVALELSGDPDRLDLTDLHCRMARDAGAMVTIGSYAGAPRELDRLELAVTQARRGWLEPRHALNAAPWRELRSKLRGVEKSPRPAARKAAKRAAARS
jgi:DNA polymerase (family X)